MMVRNRQAWEVAYVLLRAPSSPTVADWVRELVLTGMRRTSKAVRMGSKVNVGQEPAHEDRERPQAPHCRLYVQWMQVQGGELGELE